MRLYYIPCQMKKNKKPMKLPKRPVVHNKDPGYIDSHERHSMGSYREIAMSLPLIKGYHISKVLLSDWFNHHFIHRGDPCCDVIMEGYWLMTSWWEGTLGWRYWHWPHTQCWRSRPALLVRVWPHWPQTDHPGCSPVINLQVPLSLGARRTCNQATPDGGLTIH